MSSFWVKLIRDEADTFKSRSLGEAGKIRVILELPSFDRPLPTLPWQNV